jgi:serine/threonine protein kinase
MHISLSPSDPLYDIYVPPPPGWEIISGGSTARVEWEIGRDEVVKVLYPKSEDAENEALALQREFEIYKKLPKHARLLTLLDGSTPRRLVFPYLTNGTLHDRIFSDGPPLEPRQRLQLAADAAEGVGLLHAHDVVHCDIGPRNFMFDDEHRLRVIDFAGSGVDGQKGFAIESARYFLPRPWTDICSFRTDIFALGSLLYTILTGVPPYKDKTEEEVEQLYSIHVFPATIDIPCGEVISGCWNGLYSTAGEVYDAICTALKDDGKNGAPA